jgi:O-antigen ligase
MLRPGRIFASFTTGAADVVAYIFNLVFVFAIPWQDMVVLPGLGTISKLLGAGAVGATILHVLIRGKLRRPALFHWIALAFFGWIFLSTFWAVAQPESVQRKIITNLQLVAMLWVLWEVTSTRSRLAGMLQAYVLGAFVTTGSTIYNYLQGAALEEAYGRFAASGFDANDLGMLLALAMPMAWYLASTTRSGFQRWLNYSYFIFGIIAILLTSSRGAMIATVVALSVIPWTLTRMRPGVKIATVVMMLVAGTGAMVFVPARSFERLGTTTTEISEGTLTGRLAIWRSGILAVPQRPLGGYGPAGWYPAAGKVAASIRGAHSTWLAILVESGAVGLLLYITMFVVLLRRLRRLPTFERRIGLTLLATLTIAITPLTWDVYKVSWLMLSLLAAWAAVFTRFPAPQPAVRPGPPRPRPGRGIPSPASAR